MSAQASPPRPVRRLRPDVAAKFAARRTESDLEQLYSKPVKELSPRELALMKAAFLRRA